MVTKEQKQANHFYLKELPKPDYFSIKYRASVKDPFESLNRLESSRELQVNTESATAYTLRTKAPPYEVAFTPDTWLRQSYFIKVGGTGKLRRRLYFGLDSNLKVSLHTKDSRVKFLLKKVTPWTEG